MTSIVYCFNVSTKKLNYLKILPLFSSAKLYELYITKLLELLGETNNLIVFALDSQKTSFTVNYTMPNNHHQFSIPYNVKYWNDNCIGCIHTDPNTNLSMIIPITKISIDDNFTLSNTITINPNTNTNTNTPNTTSTNIT